MQTTAETYAMLGNDTLWVTARECHRVLEQAGVAHAVVGGVAVCLHGYRRNTVDLDLLVRREDSATIHRALAAAGFTWNSESAEFQGRSGVPIQCVIAGDRAGKDSDVRLPDPSGEDVSEIEGLPVLALAALIQSKLACGQGDLRRTHKDFADVVELIAIHQLDGSFASRLHKSVRKAYRQLVKHVHSG